MKDTSTVTSKQCGERESGGSVTGDEDDMVRGRIHETRQWCGPEHDGREECGYMTHRKFGRSAQNWAEIALETRGVRCRRDNFV